MATWQELEAELDLWRAAGERPTFWWRDDDTEAPTEALDRLIALSAKYDAPLHLAVIPADIDPGLADRLRAAPHVWAMQHGFAHKNHAPKGARASEVGQHRDLGAQERDLKEGRRRMEKAGLPNMLPIMVPPWNRIGEKVVPHLPSWGFSVLSGFERRPSSEPHPGLQLFNGHIEPLRWRPDAIFAGEEKTLAQCVGHLRERRTGVAEKDEPTGLVTHHLQTPEEVWAFCDAFCERLAQDDRAEWIALKPLIKAA
ncbi:polysaccharide deacetylase family protein [Marimonas sp. MJW-29]|uniref:Polysaccharide deacetylase family protein n=1 Tax=Sulfitobacter sediminis TaxID=3234186 RepID=A0ABV3RRG5_9RHOB